MGFKYLDGKRWVEVTRDERFFCQRLYELIREESAESFVGYLRDALGLNVDVAGEWEIGFEVCFYRDLWQLRRQQGALFSPKRTFDLCLFGEDTIIIIEAKAAVDFDAGQTAEFDRDCVKVQRLTAVNNVYLVGLCSSRCKVDPAQAAIFTGPMLRWRDVLRAAKLTLHKRPSSPGQCCAGAISLSATTTMQSCGAPMMSTNRATHSLGVVKTPTPC